MTEVSQIEVKTVYVVTCPLCGKQGAHPECQRVATAFLREFDEGPLGQELRRAAETQATMNRWHEEMAAQRAVLRERLQLTDAEIEVLWGRQCDGEGRGISWSDFYKNWIRHSPKLARDVVDDKPIYLRSPRITKE